MSDTFFDDENFNDGFNEDSYEQGMDLALWKKLLSYTLNYKKEVSILGLCAFATAVSEIAFPLITRSVIDAVAVKGADIDILFYGTLYFGFVILIGCSVGGFIWFGGKIRTHVSHDIRKEGFANLQRLSFSYYDYRPVGWLMARMTSDCERLSNILAWGLLDLVWGLTMMTGICFAMLWMDVSLAFTVLSVLPLLAWMSIKFQKRILKSARVVRKTNSRITGTFNESIMGIQTSKAFVKEAKNLDNFGGLTDKMYDSSVLNAVQAAVFLPLVLTIASLSTGLALVMGGLEVMWGTVTAGTLIAFLTYTRHFFEPIEELAHWFAEMQMAQASAERIVNLIETEPEIQDSQEVLSKLDGLEGLEGLEGLDESSDKTGAAVKVEKSASRINRIELKNVSFKYAVGPMILQNLDLTINEGENIAIVGSTGGGKTSIASVICRFYEPTSGKVLINDIDYREKGIHWLQSRLGVVLQASHLFGGSILENIRYGKLDASDTEVMEAASRAGAHSFIESLPDQYQSEVGEGGSRLSAGQKQLLAFSRAILADPDILIMDEATSSVDTETEQQIQQGLIELLKGRISIVIAHRLSTIRNADRILVVEKGSIVEQGNHTALMALQGRYHHLYSQQSLVAFSQKQDSWA